MRKLLAVSFLLLTLPLAASAVTADELRAQINALLAQITALQSGGTVPGATAVPPSTVQCPLISRNLKLGMSGDDVARLQRFLALDPAIYPEAVVSGYYGALTEAAVKRFQCKNKLVCDGTPAATGYGVTGPRTAALLALQCPDILANGGATVGGFIKVTPISGPAPLPVVIEATVNTTKTCNGAIYEVDFGDGSAPVQIPVPQGVCSETRQILNHTYTGGGTFQITLRSGVHRTMATVVVSGGPSNGTGGDTFSANAMTGDAPFSATFTGVINGTGTCNAGPYSLDFGDGETVSLPLSGCTPNGFNVTHQYTSGGNFSARLLRGSTAVGTVAITVTGGTSGGGTSNAYFSLSPAVNGDNTSITAQFDIASSCAAFDLDWGDGTGHQAQAQGTCSGGATTKEFTHDYANAGSYTLILRRGTATDTASITITQ